VAESLAEAYVHRETVWPRLIFDDGRVVGFVMGNFDPENEISAFRAGIWRRITVLWIPGEGGPEGFYLKLGFRPTGEEMGGEVVGELQL